MRLEFHPEGLREYESAVLYYEQRQPGLGERFIGSVEAAPQSIRNAPEMWPVLDEDVRRCLVRVFPYAILYTVEARYIPIIAVMHCHRKPGYWKSRLGGGQYPADR